MRVRSAARLVYRYIVENKPSFAVFNTQNNRYDCYIVNEDVVKAVFQVLGVGDDFADFVDYVSMLRLIAQYAEEDGRFVLKPSKPGRKIIICSTMPSAIVA